jgi:hypothetical protein
MDVQTWYRGFALGVDPSAKDTGGLHDIGDGIYFTSDVEAARDYAKLRDRGPRSPGTMVVQVQIDMHRFRVLDVVNDSRWTSYLATRTMPGGPSNLDLMKRSSEQYGKFFKIFCEQNNIRLGQYDIVIGHDLHSGGSRRPTVQMVLLYKNAEYTMLQGEALLKMQIVEKNGVPQRIVVDPTRVVGGPNTTPGAKVLRSMLSPADESVQRIKLDRAALDAQTRNAKVVGGAQQAAEAASLRWAGYAALVSGAAFYLNNAGLEYRVKQELLKCKPDITAAFDRGEGVLVIVHMAVEKHSEAGFLARSFQNLWVQPGRTPDEALARWRQVPRMFASLPRNAPYESVEEYRWIEWGEWL